jgi:succinoglycan biosynthesis protein ExoL
VKICFLLSYTPNPRIKKRIELVKRRYVPSLIYWKRTADAIWGKVDTDIETIEINTISNNGNPLARIIPTVKFAIQALRNLRKIRPECIYVENIDMLFIVRLYCLIEKRKVKIIYEIADVHSLLIDHQKNVIKKILQKFLRKSDAWLCKNIDILVNTSEKFYEIYYSKFTPKEKLVVMPNMPNLEVFKGYSRKTQGEFTIGFIGAVRYKTQMKMLIDASEDNNLNVMFAGAGLDDEIENICIGKKRINYYGEYDYNSEIANLYSKVDCIFSVYDADLFNVRIALPNKLYESIYCELPIIVARGTYLADLVEKMGVGVAVSHTDKKDLEQVLKRLSTDDVYYNKFVEACRSQKKNINVEIYNEKLNSAIEEVMKK